MLLPWTQSELISIFFKVSRIVLPDHFLVPLLTVVLLPCWKFRSKVPLLSDDIT